MSATRFKRLEEALLVRNPLLREKLQPGLPETRIRRALTRAKVTGKIECLLDLYTWRNGTVLDEQLTSSKAGFFPGDVYHLLDIEMALGHFGTFKDVAVHRPKLREAVGRYFPLLWDGSTGWLAADLTPSSRNRIMRIMGFDSKKPFLEAYHSFGEFISDCIRANEQNAPLTCFQQQAEAP